MNDETVTVRYLNRGIPSVRLGAAIDIEVEFLPGFHAEAAEELREAVEVVIGRLGSSDR